MLEVKRDPAGADIIKALQKARAGLGFLLLPLCSALQLVPLTAYLTVPVLELSCSTVDFETCLVAQPKAEHVFLRNRSGCRSYWAASLGIRALPLPFLVSWSHCPVCLSGTERCVRSRGAQPVSGYPGLLLPLFVGAFCYPRFQPD